TYWIELKVLFPKNISTHRHTINRVCLFSFLFLILVTTCPLWGQVVSKKELVSEDYQRWSSLINPQINSNGKWVSYMKQYDYGQDTLFVRSTSKNVQYIFPGEAWLKFSSDGRKAFIRTDSLLQIQNLVTGGLENISPIKHYELSFNEEYLLVHMSNSSNNGNDLVVRGMLSGKEYRLSGIEHSFMNPENNSLLYSIKEEGNNLLYFLDLTTVDWKPILLRETNFPFKQIAWGSSGNSLAFIQENTESENMHLHFIKSL